MSSTGRPSVTRSSEVERIIAAADVDTTFAGKKAIRYRGRRSTWPGALALAIVILGSVVGLVFYGINLHKDVIHRNETSGVDAERFGTGTWIDDGTDRGVNATTDIDVVNPEEYKDQNCLAPSFLSQSGKIVADYGGGKKVVLQVKGVNWIGMEDNKGVPKGLWDNGRQGNNIYRIGQFLVNNGFNMVRLPLSIDSVLRNTEVQADLINTNSNRALQATRYIEQLALIIEGLGRQGLGVVLDFHVLSAVSTEDNSLWYGTSIHIDDIKTAITNLATKLCNARHYNVVGLDLKDGLGNTATWGDNSDTDWAAAATTLGNHMLTACPNWLVFVQGIQGSAHKDDFDGGRSIKWKFFAGSDLTGVSKNPIKLSVQDKVVYSPKYWSSSFLPQPFFFDKGTQAGDLMKEYVESSDATLKTNVLHSMDLMFGAALQSNAAVVLSTFGGTTGDKDMTAKKTSTRILNIVVQNMTASHGLSGGFWWTLNPETYWSFPAPDSSDNATNAGLLEDTWHAANMETLKVLKGMDKMTNVATLQCQPV